MDKQPKHPFHPGEMLLEDFLEPQGVSQAEFARKMGWTKARLNELIRGKRRAQRIRVNPAISRKRQAGFPAVQAGILAYIAITASI